jgi:vacuolar-type H+-ATPase subunit I/STV1
VAQEENVEGQAAEGAEEEEVALEPQLPIMGGIRQIQKILVEPRARQLEEALDSLDRQRAKDLADLRRELDRGVGRCDDFIKTESSMLAERLSTERKERKRAMSEKVKELESDLRAMEDRLTKFEEQVASDGRELRQKVLEQHREYSSELRGWRDEMAAAIARELSGLRAEKADRSTLAKLLSEVGERLAGTSTGSVTTH